MAQNVILFEIQKHAQIVEVSAQTVGLGCVHLKFGAILPVASVGDEILL